MRYLAATEIVVEHVEAAGHRVDVVHTVTLRAPAETVRDRDPLDNPDEAVIGRDAIERAGPGRQVESHRPRPEAPGRVALGIVHPTPRQIELDRRDDLDLARLLVDDADPVAEGRHDASGLTDHDRSDLLSDLARSDRAVVGVVPVEDATVGVDEPEDARPRVPARALADLGVNVRSHLQ